MAGAKVELAARQAPPLPLPPLSNPQRCHSTASLIHAIGQLPAWLVGELRSDHAGETGAVCIYRGARLVHDWAPWVDRHSEEAVRWRAFLVEHEAAEQRHLDYLVAMNVPQSVFTSVWRLAGYVLGVVPSLVSPQAFYFTTVAVEEFVEVSCTSCSFRYQHDNGVISVVLTLPTLQPQEHYGDQIARLKDEHSGEYPELVDILVECCADEAPHHHQTLCAVH